MEVAEGKKGEKGEGTATCTSQTGRAVQGLQAKALRMLWPWERSAVADRGCLLKTLIKLTLAALRCWYVPAVQDNSVNQKQDCVQAGI